jgi:hypothetical protein
MTNPFRIKQLDTTSIPEIKIETPMPDSVMSALVAIMKEMYSMDYSKPGPNVTTTLTIKGSEHTVVLQGLIKQVDAQQKPYGADLDFGSGAFGLRGPSYGYNAMRCTTDVSLHLMLDHAECFETAPEMVTKKSQEGITMFSKHVISEVTIGEINPITLELAVKKLAAGNNNIQLVEKKDIVYLIVDGADPIELNGERFKALVETALIGKTIGEVKANANLANLITNLNVVESITLTKREVNLDDILK